MLRVWKTRVALLATVLTTVLTTTSVALATPASALWMIGAVAATAGEPVCTPLLAGQHIDAGTVCTVVESDAVVVTYATTGGWTLDATHLWVGTSIADMPRNKKGSPVLGHFPHGAGSLDGATTYTARVSLVDLGSAPCGTDFAVVAHAVVRRTAADGGTQQETAFGSGERLLVKGSWATWFVVPNPCGPQACLAPECIGLAEAVQRGFATVQVVSGPADLLIVNGGDLPICLDGWLLMNAPNTQEAAVGYRNAQGEYSAEIAPGGSLLLQRHDGDVATDPVWWCLEKPQIIWLDDFYSTSGAHVPADLFHIYEQGLAGASTDQIQVDLWYAQEIAAALTVGRERNYLGGAAGDAFSVTLQVMNLGDVAGSGTVTETVPAGATATDFSVAPLSATANPDGSTTYTFQVDVGPRVVVPAESEYDAWGYLAPYSAHPAVVAISYTLGTDGMAPDRHQSAAPTVSYSSRGATWLSQGSPLVVDLCVGD